ncbi:MAG: AAA family ATPase [Bacteroides sp. SM23_62]|nr:MAG: AAA family ATPase [Bacteroides sp. SM23_62]
MQGKILIVDDDREVLESLELLLKYEFGEVHTLSNPVLLPGRIKAGSYDLILLDMNFSAGVNTGNEGLFLLREILKDDPEAIVIMITAYGDAELAVRAIKQGATDFIQKPWNADKLIAGLKTALRLRQSRIKLKNLERDNQSLKEDLEKLHPVFIGESPPMQDVVRLIRKVAPTDANVLITGENGTGKELVARMLHRESARSGEVFVSVDLGSLSPTLFESELFGHVKGAFTDARTDRTGRIESATGGTLFLDEIGNLPLSLQSKLLAVLQQREITPIGSNRAIAVDFRLVTATNKDPFQLAGEQLFREDLLYRINTVRIDLPPLREREDDLIILTEYFLERFARKYDKPGLKIGQATLDLLKKHQWPGNIRELQHAVEHAVIMCEKDILSTGDFNLRLDKSPGKPSLNLEEVEKRTIEEALRKHHGKLVETYKELGVSRTTLYHKMKKYGLQ